MQKMRDKVLNTSDFKMFLLKDNQEISKSGFAIQAGQIIKPKKKPEIKSDKP